MVSAQSRGAGASLDDAQREVAELPVDASVVVVGAPGSGKTTTLLARVNALVAGGVDADAIQVLTPSRASATRLRDRLALAVDRATAGPLARSMASFAFLIVRADAAAAGEDTPQLLTGSDEDQIVRDLLEGDAEDEAAGLVRWPPSLGVGIRSTQGFRAEVRTFLAECTALGVEPARLAQLGERHGVEAWTAMAAFAQDYLRVRADMRGAHRDAAGLVREAVGLLRSAPPGTLVVDGLRAVLVDDAQELTLGGIELLEACRQRGIAVVAFGDPDVGSGAFRGATPENFALLASVLGGTTVLTGAHRGTPWQAELVRRVTERIGAGGVVAHRRQPADLEPDSSVRVLALRSAAEEYDVIARLLRERHVRDGVAWERCAVIAHDTRQVAALEEELSAREVPARTSGAGGALATARPARDLLSLVDLAARDPQTWSQDDAETALLGAYGRLDAIELRRLRAALRHDALRQAMPEADRAPGDAADAAEQAEPDPAAAARAELSGRELLLSGLRHPLEFELVDTREARRARTVARAIHDARAALEAGATAHELLWAAWDRTGAERAWTQLARGNGPLADQAGRDLDAVVSLFQAAKRFVERGGDADPRLFVRAGLDSGVAEDRLDAADLPGTVRVLTPAAALGGEFDTVVIAGVQEGVWPNTRLRGSLLETWRLQDAASRAPGDDATVSLLDRRRAAMHDELRLFVRALSRATDLVVITAVDDDDTGPSVLFELLPPAQPAPAGMEHPLSLRGLVAAHRRTLTLTSGPAADRAAGQLAVLARAGVAGAAPDEWYGIAAPSSSAPLRDLSREDVRVSPSRLHTLEECELNWVIADLGGDPGGTTAGIGTIIHAALEQAHATDADSLWAVVEQRWGELAFEADWRERAERTRARDLVRRLALYLERFERAGGSLIGAEPHFEVAIPIADAEELGHGAVLSGYIDRVELTPEGTVVIVDLKTGKNEPQTNAKVADNPQLAAYQLAFESGEIPAAAGLPPGGAKLLVLRPTAAKADYQEPWQAPFDDDTRTAFLSRIHAAVQVMRGTAFQAPYEAHCRDEHSYGLCRIHTVGAVSAS